MPESSSGSLTLIRRSSTAPSGALLPPLRLPLSADDRTRLRGHRRSACGRDLVLQLERGEPLQPGEWLSGAPGDPPVLVEAAVEPLLLVRASDPLELLRAAYHLGNRHVALEVRAGELRLIEDSVLADLLEQRGLELERCQVPFLPEAGAYAAAGGHRHGHGHHQGRHQSHDHGPAHAIGPAHESVCIDDVGHEDDDVDGDDDVLGYVHGPDLDQVQGPRHGSAHG